MIEPSENEQENLAGLLSFIQQAIPISYIFSVQRTPTCLHLIIVLDRYHYKQMDEIQPIINFFLFGMKDVTCTIHSYGLMNDYLNRGHIYYSSACIPRNCLYMSVEYYSLPILTFDVGARVIEQAKTVFSQSMSKAETFYKGAVFYLAQKENIIASFMLQQSCELAYRGLLLSLGGKEIRCHDLIQLQKHLSHFLPEIIGAFNIEEKQEKKLLALLHEAYLGARYHSEYEVKEEMIAALASATNRFLDQSKRIFDQRINQLASLVTIG